MFIRDANFHCYVRSGTWLPAAHCPSVGCGRSVARDTFDFVPLGVAELPVVSACARSRAITGRATLDASFFAAYALWFGRHLWELVTVGLAGTNRMTFACGFLIPRVFHCLQALMQAALTDE